MFHFLETVLLEVLQLFPSSYIHIGGDEVRSSAAAALQCNRPYGRASCAGRGRQSNA